MSGETLKVIYTYYNPNPAHLHVCDCAYRGIAAFFGITWMMSIFELVTNAANQGSVNFTHITNITDYMRRKGYQRKKPEKQITVKEFIESKAEEGHTYMISIRKQRHITIVGPDKIIMDIWDTSHCLVQYYWER